MKHIKSYNSFKESRVDEGILGNLFNKLKNKLSTEFSKKFVTGPKVDKAIEEYKKEIIDKVYNKKTTILKKIGQYVKSKIDVSKSPDEKKEILSKLSDDPEMKKQLGDYKTISEQVKKEKELIKQKFNVRIKEIVSDEKNNKIKNYIDIKKIETEQDLLKMETDSLMNQSGLTEEDIQDSEELKQIVDTINNLLTQSKKIEDQLAKAMNSKSTSKPYDEEKKFEVGSKYKYTNEDNEEVEITIKEVKEDGKKVISAEVKNDKDELITIKPYMDKIGDKIVDEEVDKKDETTKDETTKDEATKDETTKDETTKDENK